MPTTSELLIEHVKIQDALLKLRAERSLRAYVEQAWPILEPNTPFVPNWHIDLLVESIEAVTAGEIKTLLINVPPRSMKSLLVSVLWPTWEWIRRPGGRWIFASYADALATKHSVDRRTVLQSTWFQSRWGDQVQLAADQNVKGEFQNTKRGVMIATSTGGSITGKGGDRIIVDDLHNPQQAESDAQRDTALTYFRQTLSTRLDDKKTGAIVVVMQRLHERDLSAFCQDLGFTHICLPAEAETRTEIVFPRSGRIQVRETGDLLWPAREGHPELKTAKQMLGSAAYAGQYQQRPAPAGGVIFQPEWFQYYDELPPLSRLTQSWDMAFKDKATSDYVVGLVAGRRGADVYLIDRVKGQWSFSETCRQVEKVTLKYPNATRKLIEDTANGPAIISALAHQIPGMVAVQPEGGKLTRAQAVSPLVEAGNVYLPNPRPHGTLIRERAWVEDFVHQLIVFPHGAHDDDVDAFTQLLVRWLKPEPGGCMAGKCIW
jgi:predicted phage terminase large subunit-like protein